MQTRLLISKKDRLSNDRYCLLRLQEIVVTVTTASIMVPHDLPKQNENKNVPVA
jgi:hypothetical protein